MYRLAYGTYRKSGGRQDILPMTKHRSCSCRRRQAYSLGKAAPQGPVRIGASRNVVVGITDTRASRRRVAGPIRTGATGDLAIHVDRDCRVGLVMMREDSEGPRVVHMEHQQPPHCTGVYSQM